MRFFAAVVLVALSSGCALTPAQREASTTAKAVASLPPANAGQAILPAQSSAAARPLPIQAQPSPSAREVKDRLGTIPTIDLTAVPPDLWDRIRNGFAMPNLSSPLVQDRQI